ncbi:uncharacterized protein PgNI_07843 [Pyricularia grisea]|uniref:Glycosyltransferase family 32 protein n=1 Tax=Pyricularia grisea TaxID=148305 RepID=A0A6P8B0V8_PYRGI|nr:uncharacterized protein PgNI_07843 [Pyricularia grisea]TLD08353.1 hypothetical protein PgNI_07843 [Pyricularia grisea]
MANQRPGLLDIGPPRRSTRRRWSYLAAFIGIMFILSLLIHPTTNSYAKSAYDTVKGKVTGGISSSSGTHSSDSAASKTNTRPDTSKPTRHPINDGSDTIPNIAHFVYGLKDPNADLHFNFFHYLSAYSAWYHAKVHTLYLHTNAGEEALRRARSGEMGKWTKAIFDLPGFKVNYVEAPTHANNGVKIAFMAGVSDFMRVDGMLDIGGFYIDFDVFVLRDLSPLRKSGFRAIAGRQMGPNYNSGTFMAAPNSLFIKNWQHLMQTKYDGTWERHSTIGMREVATALVPIPGEMLVLDQDAFAPLGWDENQSVEIFAPHNGTEPLLKTLGWKPGMDGEVGDGPLALDLPVFVEGDESDRPFWARDWSASYLLHAFQIERSSGWHVDGFDHLTPKYALDRQSNAARAVYPIVRDMYYRGLVKITDRHDEP